MKKAIYVIFIITGLLMAMACTKSTSSIKPILTREFQVGALLPLSGAGDISGRTTSTALSIAAEEINKYFQELGSNIRVKLFIEDTQTDPSVALEKLKLLHQKGIKIIIGTYSSSEAAACKPFADQNNILMISQSSESQSLAIPGDNLFRLIPPVSKQAEAMVKMMQADTILAVFPMVRDDVWGTELFSGFATLFSKAGFYVGDRVLYATTTTEFSGFLNTLDGIVALGFVPYNPKRIAVYLISFSEGETILAQAGNYTSLNQVKWYGSSSFAQNSNVLQNSRAATFAITHRGISSPVLGLEEGARDKWQLLDEQIFAISNDHPDIFSLIAYDILWLAAKTQWVCDYGNGIEQFKTAFTLQADQFYGATGRTALDENGDRASGNFDFWSIRQDAAKYIWSREAVYNTATGQLVRFP